MKYKLAFTFFCFFILTSCGFKLVQNTYDFSIVNINTSGDKNISYLVKNKLNFGSKEKVNQLEIEIFSEKLKTIKEKNIANEITKYEIKIVLNISKYGDFDVTAEHLNTLNNEKKLVEVLVNKVIEEILFRISVKLNDL